MKKIFVIVLYTALVLLGGCDTYQEALKSLCQECLMEAKSRAHIIAKTLLKSKNSKSKLEREVLVIEAKNQLLKVSCSDKSGGILDSARKKGSGAMASPQKVAFNELKNLYCPKTLKKYVTKRK